MGPSTKNNLQGCAEQEYQLTCLDIKDFVCFVLFVFVRHVFRIVRFRSSCSLANFLSAKTDLVEDLKTVHNLGLIFWLVLSLLHIGNGLDNGRLQALFLRSFPDAHFFKTTSVCKMAIRS